jgi:hypothetical protein
MLGMIARATSRARSLLGRHRWWNTHVSPAALFLFPVLQCPLAIGGGRRRAPVVLAHLFHLSGRLCLGRRNFFHIRHRKRF